MFLIFPFTSMSSLPLPSYTRTPHSFSHPNSHLLTMCSQLTIPDTGTDLLLPLSAKFQEPFHLPNSCLLPMLFQCFFPTDFREHHNLNFLSLSVLVFLCQLIEWPSTHSVFSHQEKSLRFILLLLIPFAWNIDVISNKSSSPQYFPQLIHPCIDEVIKMYFQKMLFPDLCFV